MKFRSENTDDETTLPTVELCLHEYVVLMITVLHHIDFI